MLRWIILVHFFVVAFSAGEDNSVIRNPDRGWPEPANNGPHKATIQAGDISSSRKSTLIGETQEFVAPVESNLPSSRATVKEKRCHMHDFVGKPLAHDDILRLSRREALRENFIKKTCESCREGAICKKLGKCEACNAICQGVKLADNANAAATPEQTPFQTENTPKASIPAEVASRNSFPSEQLGLPPNKFHAPSRNDGTRDTFQTPNGNIHPTNKTPKTHDSGLRETEDRLYTIGAFSKGPMKNLLARLLNISKKDKLDSLVVLAKTKSKFSAPEATKPVVIDTAHVFTVNNGPPEELKLEVHPVKTDGAILDLTAELNKELDMAIEHKKKLLGDSHLSSEEIDKIIDHAVSLYKEAKKNPKSKDENVATSQNVSGDASSKTEEQVGCSKEEDDDYYRAANEKQLELANRSFPTEKDRRQEDKILGAPSGEIKPEQEEKIRKGEEIAKEDTILKVEEKPNADDSLTKTQLTKLLTEMFPCKSTETPFPPEDQDSLLPNLLIHSWMKLNDHQRSTIQNFALPENNFMVASAQNSCGSQAEKTLTYDDLIILLSNITPEQRKEIQEHLSRYTSHRGKTPFFIGGRELSPEIPHQPTTENVHPPIEKVHPPTEKVHPPTPNNLTKEEFNRIISNTIQRMEPSSSDFANDAPDMMTLRHLLDNLRSAWMKLTPHQRKSILTWNSPADSEALLNDPQNQEMEGGDQRDQLLREFVDLLQKLDENNRKNIQQYLREGFSAIHLFDEEVEDPTIVGTPSVEGDSSKSVGKKVIPGIGMEIIDLIFNGTTPEDLQKKEAFIRKLEEKIEMSKNQLEGMVGDVQPGITMENAPIPTTRSMIQHEATTTTTPTPKPLNFTINPSKGNETPTKEDVNEEKSLQDFKNKLNEEFKKIKEQESGDDSKSSEESGEKPIVQPEFLNPKGNDKMRANEEEFDYGAFTSAEDKNSGPLDEEELPDNLVGMQSRFAEGVNSGTNFETLRNNEATVNAPELMEPIKKKSQKLSLKQHSTGRIGAAMKETPVLDAVEAPTIGSNPAIPQGNEDTGAPKAPTEDVGIPKASTENSMGRKTAEDKVHGAPMNQKNSNNEEQVACSKEESEDVPMHLLPLPNYGDYSRAAGSIQETLADAWKQIQKQWANLNPLQRHQVKSFDEENSKKSEDSPSDVDETIKQIQKLLSRMDPAKREQIRSLFADHKVEDLLPHVNLPSTHPQETPSSGAQHQEYPNSGNHIFSNVEGEIKPPLGFNAQSELPQTMIQEPMNPNQQDGMINQLPVNPNIVQQPVNPDMNQQHMDPNIIQQTPDNNHPIFSNINQQPLDPMTQLSLTQSTFQQPDSVDHLLSTLKSTNQDTSESETFIPGPLSPLQESNLQSIYPQEIGSQDMNLPSIGPQLMASSINPQVKEPVNVQARISEALEPETTSLKILQAQKGHPQSTDSQQSIVSQTMDFEESNLQSKPLNGSPATEINIPQSAEKSHTSIEDNAVVGAKKDWHPATPDTETFKNLGKFQPIEKSTHVNTDPRYKNMFFVGNGIKLPLHFKQNKDGTIHLSVDMEKLCSCKDGNCGDLTGSALKEISEANEELQSPNVLEQIDGINRLVRNLPAGFNLGGPKAFESHLDRQDSGLEASGTSETAPEDSLVTLNHSPDGVNLRLSNGLDSKESSIGLKVNSQVVSNLKDWSENMKGALDETSGNLAKVQEGLMGIPRGLMRIPPRFAKRSIGPGESGEIFTILGDKMVKLNGDEINDLRFRFRNEKLLEDESRRERVIPDGHINSIEEWKADKNGRKGDGNIVIEDDPKKEMEVLQAFLNLWNNLLLGGTKRE